MPNNLTDVTDNNVGKMSDNEIKKALECKIKFKCNECPYFDGFPCSKCHTMLIAVLDLINRLQARVEKCEKVEHFADKTIATLQAENERLIGDIMTYKVRWAKAAVRLDNAKAEAYKEFAERLNKEAEKVEIDREGDFVETDNKIYDTVANWCKATSDNLLKEMVGEDNG